MFSATRAASSLGLAHLDDVEVQLRLRELRERLAQRLDVGALLADDDARAGGVDRHPALAVRALDHDAADAGLRDVLLDVLADGEVLVEELAVFLAVGEPAAVPGAVDLQPEADRIDLLTHYAVSSLTCRTLIVTWLNGFRILPKRPRARGRPRFRTRFLPTKASATTSSSTSRPWLFSALAIADCSVFLTSSLTRFFEKVRSASALLDRLVADHRGDEVQLLRAGLQHPADRHRLVLRHAARVLFLAHGLLPLRFLVGRMPVVGTGRASTRRTSGRSCPRRR